MATAKQYALITAEFIKAVEAGTPPWHKPWTGEKARNGLTDRPYTGLNPFTLWAVAHRYGYESAIWLTFKQAKQLGGYVKKGARSTPVYFWKFDEVTVKDAEMNTVEKKTVPFLKISFVFNLDQTEGVTLPKRRNPQPFTGGTLEFEPMEAAQAIVDNYIANGGPKLDHSGGDAAFYVPSTDTIALPARQTFHSIDEYYSTAFHELGHSTGHPSRENRFAVGEKTARFGSQEYSKEELVAEFTSAFLAAESGIDTTRENSQAYIAGWLRKIKEEPSILVTAAGKAQKAANRILAATVVEDQDNS